MSTHAQDGGAPVAAVLFEPYGTLLDLETDERDWYAYLNLARFLEYRGVRFSADELRWLWFERVARHQATGDGAYPEFRARTVWQELLTEHAGPSWLPLDLESGTLLTDLTMLHRALTRRTLRLMDGVRPLLEELAGRVRLGIVSDCQPEYVLPELQIAGIDHHFQARVVSGAQGFRKPDARLFAKALRTLGVPAGQALFVGVDTGRDVAGARAAGMRSVLALTPYGSKDTALGEPDYVIDRTAELLPLLDRLSPSAP